MSNRYVECILKLLQKKEISRQTAHTLIKEFEKEQKLPAFPFPEKRKIAIIGMSCRMPQASNIAEFWKNLSNEVDCIQEFPAARRQDTDPYLKQIHPDLFINSNPYWHGGFLDRIDLFDCQFFNILPGEAKYIDPQQRLFLEVAFEAMEDAGYTEERLRQSRTGVYIGHCDNEYKSAIREASPAAVPGNLVPFIASRIAYTFDLRGPAISTATTCSSSLIALHTACQALREGDCETALVGATNLYLFPVNVKNDSVYTVGISAQDYRCRTFDSKANGVVRGEGSIALFLKPYEKALADRDQIHAVILGSAVNNDGHSSSLTAPNPLAQADMLKAAWENAGVDPQTISYIEAHGTGTKLGDPIEIQALNKAFAAYTEKRQFCGIGSLKTNIGHLVSGASGLAGVLKTVLSLKNKKIPATLHFKEPNPLINFKESAVYVVDKLQEWKSSILRAGVSAFGFNGTNGHVVLEAIENPESSSNSFEFYILPISANSPSALMELVQRYVNYLNAMASPSLLGDMCFTAAVGRTHRKHRVCLVFSHVNELLSKLNFFLHSPFTDIAQHIYVSSSSNKEEINKEEVIDPSKGLPPSQIAQAYSQGKKILWKSYYKDTNYHTISLPHYPFERQRVWIEDTAEENIKAFYGSSFLSKDTISQGIQEGETQISHFFDEEKAFLSTCAQVLGLPYVKLEDDFFSLGGDSLLGIQLINSLHKIFNRKISLDVIFASARLEDILAAILTLENSPYQAIPPQPIAEKYPVSSAQRRLWLLDQMQDERNAYNMYDAYLFNGDLNIKAFEKSLGSLGLRHEALRTTFIIDESQPYQRISPSLQLDYRFAEASSEKESYKLLEEIVKDPFDLTKGPLFKALLVRLTHSSSPRFLFGFVIHHTICDGWSLHLMIKEILIFYENYCQELPLALPVLRLQYKDYAAWQVEPSQGAALLTQQNYWLEKLKGELPICEIKGDLERPPVFTFQGKRTDFYINSTLVNQLREIAKQQQASLYMALLASVYVLVFRYSGEQDLLIGSPVSGRSHYDLRHIIGCFVNTLVMRTQIEPERGFVDLLQKVKQTVFEAFEHQDYPFDRLVDELHLPRDTGRAPLFNINVVLQNVDKHLADIRLGEVSIEPIEISHQTAKWDLEFEFSEQKDGSLHCFLEYYQGAYSDSMIQFLIETYLCLLQSLTQSPQAPLLQAKALTDSHIKIVNQTLLSGFKTPQETLHGLFIKQAEKTPFAIATRCNTQELSYQDLNLISTRIAQLLLKNGIKVGSLVGIFMENSSEVIASILGVLKTGAAYVPLEAQHPYHRLKTLITEAQITFIITLKKHLRVLDDLQWACPSFSSYLCLDSENLWEEKQTQTELMNEQLWDYVADQAHDDIQASGWVSSYTGIPFSSEEMKEYRDNTRFKLESYLSKDKRVLEVGCGSGLTLETIAPLVGFYIATDLSKNIAQRTLLKAKKLGLEHATTVHMPAHDLSQLSERDFDIVLMNSVVHCFPSLAYLKKVILETIEKLSSQGGIIFIGDIMNLDSREILLESLNSFKQTHSDPAYKTKTEFETELFVSKSFFEDLGKELQRIQSVQYSMKQYTIENELSCFRYDVILEVAPLQVFNAKKVDKNKYQWDRRALQDSDLCGKELPTVFPAALAYILFTSGSTGKPKGVLVSHQNLIHYTTWANEYYFKEESSLCFPFYSSLSFDLTLTSIFCPLFKGGTINVYQGEFHEIIELISKDLTNNVIKLTPAHLSCIADCQLNLSHLKKYIIGGDALYGPSVAFLAQQGDPEIYNEYGPTEATVGCVIFKTRASQVENIGKIPIGIPMAQTNVYILDQYHQRVPIGGIGEIFIAGPSLAIGYLKNEQLTHEQFLPNYIDPSFSERMYRTGDLGRFLPNGLIEYMGRKDRQIKLRSHRVELGEIEAQLKQYPHIAEGIVLLLKEENGNGVLVGYFSALQAIDLEDLRKFLAERLPEYMVPQQLIELPSIPLTVNGKINTKALPKPATVNSKKMIAPSNEVEAQLAKIWEKLLSIESVSIEDDFFELGGDSITAMRLLTHAKHLGIELTVKDIFQYRTIKAMAQKNIVSKNSSFLTASKASSKRIILSPIQEWFFQQNFANPHYFNMGYLFRLPDSIDIMLLREAIQNCIDSHEMLRANFDLSTVPITQEIRSHIDFQLSQISLQHLSYKEQKIELEQYAQKTQKAIDISKDLLIIGAIFDLGEKGLRLLLIVHHLIIDGVSWRILAEDIHSYYYTKQTLEKTDSFSQWTSRIYNFLQKASLDLRYWLKIAEMPPQPFMREVPVERTQNRYIHQTVSLSKQETKAFRTSCQNRLKVNLHDALLSAFSCSLFHVCDINELWINLESTGRDFSLAEEIGCNMLRTVGWFTALYPILVKAQPNLIETVLWVQNTLKALPMGGLAYLLGKQAGYEQLKQLDAPQILFNYFGQVEKDLMEDDPDALFQPCVESFGSLWDSRNALPYLLEVNAIILNGELRIEIESHQECFTPTEIEQFKEHFKHCLEMLASERFEEITL